MSRNWIRQCKLTVDGDTIVDLTGKDKIALRIKFIINKQIVEDPGSCWIRVYNLQKDHARKLVKEHLDVKLEAGYVGNIGPIYTGKTIWVITGRESPTDTYLDLFCQDMDVLSRASINKTYDPGSTQREHVTDLLKTFEPDIMEGKIQGLSDQKYPKSVSFYSMSTPLLRNIAQSNDQLFWVENGKLNMVPASDNSGLFGTVTLDENHGLVGMPQMTPKGIIVTALINPAYLLGVLLEIDSSKINLAAWDTSIGGWVTSAYAYSTLGVDDGLYKIQSVEWRGDTYGQEWYAIMSCYGAKKGAPTEMNSLRMNM